MERAEDGAELDIGDAAGKPGEQGALAGEEAEPTATFALDRASALYRLGRYDEALPAYERAIELAPNSAMLWKWHGRTLYQLKRYEEGITSCQRAIELDATDAQAWFFLGLCDAALQRQTEAVEAYEQAITLDARHYVAWGNLGIALAAQGRYQQAIEAFDHALEIEPTYTPAISNRGAALNALGRFEEALITLNEALRLEPERARAWVSKTIALAELHRFEEAYEASQHALGLVPNDQRVLDIAAKIRRDVPDQRITLRDGRTLGYVEVGDPDGAPVFFFHGRPGSRLDGIRWGNTCRALHIRLICPDRPGMGLSDYHRRRKLRDWPADVAQLADALGIGRFVVAGVSGGGPYALACAYALPERVLAAGLISSAGPLGVRGALRALPWRNRVSQIVGRLGLWPLIKLGAMANAQVARTNPSYIARLNQWRNLDTNKVNSPDKSPPVAPTYREVVAEPFRQGSRGVAREMWIADHRWGFQLDCIKPPVLLWHGELDPMAPVVFAEYFAARIPTCQPTYYPGEKHGLIFKHEREIFAALAKAGRPPA